MIERKVHIDATPETVWQVWLDIDRWPEWSESFTEIEQVDGGPLAVGRRVRIKQPKILPMVWRVTELEPERSFVWAAKMAGVTTTAGHTVEPDDGDGGGSGDGVVVTLTVEQSGLLAPLTRLFTRRTAERYVAMEAEGLKRRAEEI